MPRRGHHQDYNAGGLRGASNYGCSPYQIDLESQLEATQYNDHSTNAAGEKDFMIGTPRLFQASRPALADFAADAAMELLRGELQCFASAAGQDKVSRSKERSHRVVRRLFGRDRIPSNWSRDRLAPGPVPAAANLRQREYPEHHDQRSCDVLGVQRPAVTSGPQRGFALTVHPHPPGPAACSPNWK